jgi:hypothetical protein
LFFFFFLICSLFIQINCFSETIEELIELRKYRKRPQGIDAEKLSKGETKAKKKKKDDKIVAGDFDELDETGENEK